MTPALAEPPRTTGPTGATGSTGAAEPPEVTGRGGSTGAAEPAELAAVFGALAEPHRRRVLRLVAAEEHTVGELVVALDVRQSAVSQHLKVLRDAGLVEVRAEGNRRIYRGRPEGLAPLYDFVRSLWPTRLEALRDLVESDLGQGVGRTGAEDGPR